MASARARFVASLALAATVSFLPAVTSTAAATTLPLGGTVSTATTVRSATATSHAVTRAMLRNPVLRGRLVVAEAARFRGVPYRAGGTTPRTGFDCSGFTRYVFAQLGIHLPRVSRQQYASMMHISRSQAVPGDLVFFHTSRGWIYHVAIYAGANTVWHSPYPGRRVARERIWTSAVYFGRVRVR